MPIDLDSIVAIDVHTHTTGSVEGLATLNEDDGGVSLEKFFEHFGTEVVMPTLHDVAAHFKKLEMICVTFTVVDTTVTGRPPLVSNDEVIELSALYPDTVIPFGSVDPHTGRAGALEVERLVGRGARGFKFHPSGQAFFPNDRDVYPIYEAIEATGLPALFHTGHCGAGSGQPGGGGLRLKYSNPMLLDDVAVDFPRMPMIMAHPSFPWQDEALSVAMHKQQVYIDLSGWSPKYFPPNLVQYANGPLREKMLFGSDYPMITPERWMSDFEKIPIKDEVRPLILKENAARLLGLT